MNNGALARGRRICSDGVVLDILIPTYNRCEFLKRSLTGLKRNLREEKLLNRVRLIVSDNHSSDGTEEFLRTFAFEEITNACFRQERNIGGDPNCVFLLGKASSPFVMFLGDDDFLPSGYLSFVLDKIESEQDLSALIPGVTALHRDGTKRRVRVASYDEKYFSKGFSAVAKLSTYGHQLSGVLLRREKLYKGYTCDPRLRNSYPFIYFLGANSLRGTSVYVPKFQVLVSEGNSKDWGYDDSGLLIEVFRNFKLLFPESRAKEVAACLFFMNRQRWRLRLGEGLNPTWKSFSHLAGSPEVSIYIKIILPFAYAYFFVRLLGGRMRRLNRHAG